MAFLGNNPKFNTGTLTPQSADPSNPVEGMIFYSNGTPRTEGVWKYQDGNWEHIGSLVDHLKLNPLAADPSSPVEGQMFYADGTSRSEGLWIYKNGNWTQVGSNSGESNFYEKGDADSANTGDFSSGNNATFDNGGTLQGIFSISTTAADLISGSKVFKLVLHATPGTSNNDFVTSDAINIPQGYRGRVLGLKLQYKYSGVNNDIKWVVKDQTNTTILTDSTEFLEAHNSSNTAKELTIAFFCPASCTQIKIGPQVVTHATGSEVLLWDDVVVTPNMLVSTKALKSNTLAARIDNNGSTATITSQGPENFIASVSRVSTGIVDVTFVTGYFASIPAITACVSDTANTSSGDADAADVKNVATTGCRVKISDTNAGTAVDLDFALMVVKQGNDTPTDKTFVAYSAATNKNSEIRLTGANGQGSTNTAIRRFSTTESSVGSAITYSDSATLGGSFTINEEGIYHISYTDGSTTGGSNTVFGISKNSNQLTTSIASITASHRLCYDRDQTSSVQPTSTVSWSGLLSIGDVIRAHTEVGSLSASFTAQFTITKIAPARLLGVPKNLVVFLRDEKTAGTDGGTATSGSYQTRTLNTVNGDSEIVSLSSNQFTLGPGKYNIEASAPAYRVNYHKARLRNITDGTTTLVGSNAEANNTVTFTTRSHINGQIELTSTKVFEIQHRPQSTQATNGFGTNVNLGEVEVYTIVKIEKLS